MHGLGDPATLKALSLKIGSDAGVQVLRACEHAGMHASQLPQSVPASAYSSSSIDPPFLKVLYAPADLRKPAEIRSMVKSAADTLGGKLDILGEHMMGLCPCSTRWHGALSDPAIPPTFVQ